MRFQREARARAEPTPDPVRRVAHGRDGGLCFRGGVDHGDQQVLHAQVQVLLEQHGVVDRRSDDGLDGVAADGLELGEDGFEAVGAVFGIDQEPVQPGPGAQFGDERAARAHPHPDEGPAGRAGLVPQGVAERAVWFYSNRHVTTPKGP